VLWALAEQQDEPERQEGSLRLSESSEIPSYYREIVESCLSDDPRNRKSAKDLFAMFPNLETASSEQQDRDTTNTTTTGKAYLSPHRTEKEYIDPTTAVDLEDIDNLKATSTHASQFSASEATFADGATSTEYLFVSSGSDIAGPRGRSPASFDARRSRRRSRVSVDVDVDSYAGGAKESPVAPVKYDPRTLDMPALTGGAPVAMGAVEHPISSTDAGAPAVAIDGLSVPLARSPPASAIRQDSKHTFTPKESTTAAGFEDDEFGPDSAAKESVNVVDASSPTGTRTERDPGHTITPDISGAIAPSRLVDACPSAATATPQDTELEILPDKAITTGSELPLLLDSSALQHVPTLPFDPPPHQDSGFQDSESPITPDHDSNPSKVHPYPAPTPSFAGLGIDMNTESGEPDPTIPP
jgi:hypothetical protein